MYVPLKLFRRGDCTPENQTAQGGTAISKMRNHYNGFQPSPSIQEESIVIAGTPSHWFLKTVLSTIVIPLTIAAHAPAQGDAGGKYDNYKAIVAETHAASLKLRKQALAGYLNTDPDTRFPNSPNWGGPLWSMVALYLNERTDEANQVILDLTNEYLPKYRSGEISPIEFKPESGKNLPFGFFATPEYVRMLYMFGENSTFYPGRLKPETEKAMKDFMWIIVSEKSKVAEATPERLLVYQGTENHDIVRRPHFYLMNYLFMNDPDYRDRPYKDGYTAKDHYEAYNKYFLARPGVRAMAGHWVEAGSDTYQKYTPPSILNMAELAPDPLVRRRYRMLLDLIFIEDAQISVDGRRGGGRSRAGYAKNPWEATKWIMYGISAGDRFGSSHNKVFETSTYQLPASAILLRNIEFPTEVPFEISNRVIGEMDGIAYVSDEDRRNGFKLDGRHVNYAYRTPHYLMGGYLQDPTLTYHGIAKQNRWCGVVFDHPDARHTPGTDPHPIHISAVYPWYEKADDSRGRPQNPLWGVNHKNVMIVQRIPDGHRKGGSYNAGAVDIRFYGKMLEKTGRDGWIFASDGNAFVGVKFLDDDYVWNEAGDIAAPQNHRKDAKPRYLIHAGDIQSHGSLERFISQVLDNELSVEDDRVRYRSVAESIDLVSYSYDPGAPEAFELPRINGEVVDLSPDWTYKSPYINSAFKEKTITVIVGPVREVYDFGD